MCQVCTLRWFSQTETCIHLKPLLISFLLTRCWATVFLPIIRFACIDVHHRSAVSFDANTWRCSIMYCSCGVILQSICSRYILCPLHWSVYSFAPQIFWSSVYYNILNGHIIICCWCGADGRHKNAKSISSMKMASEKCKDHARHTHTHTHSHCIGENVWIRNWHSLPPPVVRGSREGVTVISTLGEGCRMTFFISQNVAISPKTSANRFDSHY